MKNPDVRADFIKTLHFWLDHGADGFRVDVAHGLAKDLDRDDLDDFKIIGGEMHCADGTHPLYDRNEVHDIYREWRKVFNEYLSAGIRRRRSLVPPEHQYRYASPEELGQVFNFEFAKKDWIRNDMHLAIEEGIAAAERSGSTSTWVMSNHDIPATSAAMGCRRCRLQPTTNLPRIGCCATVPLTMRIANSARSVRVRPS